MTARLELQDLHVHHGRSQAVAVPHLRVEPGTLAAVIGANGAGKSTLVNAVANWSRAAPRITGQVLLDGTDMAGRPSHDLVARGLLLVPEGRGIFMGLSVEENLRAITPPAPAPGRAAWSLDDVYALFPRLAERRTSPGGTLSGGERQMLAVGRALRLAPRLLLLDEPSIGLAPLLVTRLLAAVRTLVDAGLTVLLVEQNVHAAVAVADTLHVLERGQLVASGPCAELMHDPRIAEAYLGTAA